MSNGAMAGRSEARKDFAALLVEAQVSALDTRALPAPVGRSRRAPAIEVARGLAETDLADRLEGLTSRSLERAGDILELDISDREHDKFGESVRALNAAIKTVLATQTRVDEHRLRQRKQDTLPELLKLIAQEEARRGAVVIEG